MKNNVLKNKKGFTLMEILIVIFIITLIGTLVTVYFFQIRKNVRDSKRLSDISEIQLALENYKFFEGQYPTELVPGAPLIGSTTEKIFLNKIPDNPDYYSFDCDYNDYSYYYDFEDGDYKISFCLEGSIENFSLGEKCVLSGKILNEPCSFGLYSIAQITNLIEIEGYVPVANSEELNALRDSVLQNMGSGTQWEGNYLTGLDKKYVQVRDIDCNNYDNWSPIGTFVGVYDGNELEIKNLTITNRDNSGLFNSCSGATLKNIICNNFNINSNNGVGAIVRSFANNSRMENCLVKNSSISGSSVVGGVVGIVSENSYVIYSKIINSYIYGKNSSNSVYYMGGFVGVISESSGSGTYSYVSKSEVINCEISKEHNSRTNRRIGGFVGATVRTSKVENCGVSYSSVLGGGSSASNSGVGGFVGVNGVVSVGNYPWVKECYCSAIVGRTSGSTIAMGGFCGLNYSSIANDYYDTDISGLSDNSKGLPRTTLQMIRGKENSYILPNGQVDPDELSANSIYSDWDPIIWSFNSGSEYPSIIN